MKVDGFLEAMDAERSYLNKGLGFEVTAARWEEKSIVVAIEPMKGYRSTAIDESLEGYRAVWGKETRSRGEVFFAIPDNAELVIKFPSGALPIAGDAIWLYPRDFLTPLIELWDVPEYRTRAIKASKRQGDEALHPVKPLPKDFAILRSRQADAVDAVLYSSALVVGPPGTGKTFTVGAQIAYLLTRFKNSRILLIGPTNIAVDTALLSADDWLLKMRKENLRRSMKRIGSHFDTKKYKDRAHLLAPGIYEASSQLSILELDEPSKSDVPRYVAWKEKLRHARKALKANVTSLAASSRLVGITVASALIWYKELSSAGRWHFSICDESSQMMAPAALMLAGLSEQNIFAGDPNQLSPIVQNPDKAVQAALTKTAFAVVPGARRICLNEQSRMCVGICDAISRTFYEGDLMVCSRVRKDEEWKKARSPWYINGREVPRIMFDDRADEAKWSNKFNGFIRFRSAQIIEAIVSELLSSYTDAKDILILTPFRAQRTLIRSFLKRDPLRGVRVSTVHRSQGTESKIVVFDPVDAGSAFLNSETGRQLINVAISRAQAHVVIIVNSGDLKNPWLNKIHKVSQRLWHKKGKYAEPLVVPFRDKGEWMS